MAQRVDHVNYKMQDDRLPAVDTQPNDDLDDILPLEGGGAATEPPFDCGSPVMAGDDEKAVNQEAKKIVAKVNSDADKQQIKSEIEKLMEEARDREKRMQTMFSGFKVHILPGAFMYDAVRMFAKFGWKKAEDLIDADLVVFIGGADVSPYLYGQKACKVTSANSDRDKVEMKAFDDCQKLAIPTFGICRGLQFLHVCNQGELWQDVDSHAGTSHEIIDLQTEERFKVTSIHHQMVMPGTLTMQVLATTPTRITHHFQCDEVLVTFPNDKKMVRMGDQDIMFEGVAAIEEPEIEAAYYPNTKSLGVQGHPEIGSPQYQAWSMQKIADMFFELGIDNPRND